MKRGAGSLPGAGCGTAQRLLPFYVNGSLEGDEAEEVRAHLDTCAACRREMAILLPLARAVEAHGATFPAAPAVPLVSALSPNVAVSAAEQRAARAVIVRRGSWLAAAAAIVLVAGSLWPFLRPGGGPSDRPAEPYVLDLGNGPERGDDQLPVLASRLGDRALILVFFVPVSPDARYAADLVGARGQVLAHADAVGPPDSLGRISWTVPPRVVEAPGEHEVMISRTDQGGDRRIYRYAFRVDPPPAGDDQTGR